MKRLLIVCLCGMAALSACKKNKTADPVTPNPTPGSNKVDLICQSWQMTYSVVNGPGIPDTSANPDTLITNLFARMQPCQKDNILSFFNSGATYSIVEGDLRCRPTDGEFYQTGTWSFVNNEAGITQKYYVKVPVKSKQNPAQDSTTTSVLVTVQSVLDTVTETRLRLTYPMTVNGQSYSVSTGYMMVE